MRKIAIASRKGGVGKSTTAVHLAHALAMAGSRVLLIDTDTQAHCSRILGVDPGRGLAELMDKAAAAAKAITPARERHDLLAGGKALAGINRLIARENIRPELVLTKTLESVDAGYRYVIVDTAPGFAELSINVLFYVHQVIVPVVSMEMFATDGLLDFEEGLQRIMEYHQGLEILYVVPTFVDGRVRKTETILEALRAKYAGKVGPSIRYSVALSEVPGWGKTVFEYAPRNRAAADYAQLAGAVA
jgi:chromosome partitioning protein